MNIINIFIFIADCFFEYFSKKDVNHINIDSEFTDDKILPIKNEKANPKENELENINKTGPNDLTLLELDQKNTGY